MSKVSAIAVFISSTINGTVKFTEYKNKVKIDLSLSGLNEYYPD